ncbi:MAG: hypothetical protein KF715_06770 [Candidatus Didemnitutus sp.]|nr:hypothetical protein [Candidatus Didemnitutus sp.]
MTPIFSRWLKHPKLWRRLSHLAALVLAATTYVVIYRFLARFAGYPIELEWREGTAWLHALAGSFGVNIFTDPHLAYANANHGIFDPLIKSVFVRALPSVEPQYILRSFVLLFPVVSLLASFVHSRRKLPLGPAVVAALGLSAAMLILLHDIGHWNTCIGRSDSTALTLLAVAFLGYAAPGDTTLSRVSRHGACLAIALVFSTNWRIYPVALVIPLLVEQSRDALRLRDLVRLYLVIAAYTIGTCAVFAAVWFHGDLAQYYRYFFGFFGTKSPWAAASSPFATMIHYVRTPAFAAIIVLSILPVLFESGKWLLARSGSLPRTLAALALALSLGASIAAFKMNFQGAGYWYLSPQAFVLLVYYQSRFTLGPGAASALLIGCLGMLWRSDNLPLMRWQYAQLAETLPAARRYTAELVLLDREFGICSEEAHLFKRTRNLPPVDMGDVAEAFANANYFGPRFTAVFAQQRARIVAREPVLVFVGGCGSSALKQLAQSEEYCLFRTSPTLWIGGAVYVRLDHLEEVQRFLVAHAAELP